MDFCCSSRWSSVRFYRSLERTSKLVPVHPVLLQAVNFVFSPVVITALFAMIYKFLPDIKLQWSDVTIGAAVTAVLFTIGKQLIGMYLGTASVGSTYGA